MKSNIEKLPAVADGIHDVNDGCWIWLLVKRSVDVWLNSNVRFTAFDELSCPASSAVYYGFS
jgi:hypothetical protein